MIDEALDDHGNSRDSATFITENSTTSGKIDDGADIDYFRVDLSEDGNLFVKINQNLELKLYDGEGNPDRGGSRCRRWAGWRCRR